MLFQLHQDVRVSLLEVARRLVDVVRLRAGGHAPIRSDQEGCPVASPDSDGLGDSIIDQIIASGFGRPWFVGVRTCAKLQVELRYTFAPRPWQPRAVEVTGSADITLHCDGQGLRSIVNVSVTFLIS